MSIAAGERSPIAAADSPAAEQLLDILRQTYLDIHRHAPPLPLTLDASLDRDLGFDSLDRVELLLRLERRFARQLPDAALETAECGRDLLRLLAAAPATGPLPPPRARLGAGARADTTALRAPPSLQTLVDVLDWHVRMHGEQLQLCFLAESGGELLEQPLSYRGLQQAAETLAAGLQARGLSRGETVAIMLPTSLDYFAAYFGVLIAGGVPVPIYPPLRPAQIEDHLRRQRTILDNAGTRLLITLPAAQRFARWLRAAVPALQQLLTPDMLRSRRRRLIRPPCVATDLAFLQYTSGSTGNPKGVMLTHANLLANIRAFGAAVGFAGGDVVVSWLPLYHDMGLIAAWLGALHHGVPLVVMSPTSFLSRPERWLWAIHRYRGTLTAAPNFAYELCLRRVDPRRLAGLDLSSLRFAANGSEQVLPETLERFRETFAAYGLRAEALQPVYGLAEATVGLAVPRLGQPARIDRIDRDCLAREQRARPAHADDAQALRVASCGRPLPGHALRVVDAAGRPLNERCEGRLEFRGPSATPGYYGDAARTRRLFRSDGWVDTGDRGYLVDGEVYITGRVKDIIIRGGRNLYPDEIEQAVCELPGVRRGCVCAFGLPDVHAGTERLVVLAETRETDRGARQALRSAILQRVGHLVGAAPDDVVLAAPGSVLKTSSGKLRRAATRERYLQHGADAGHRGQALRLLTATLRPRLQRARRRSLELVYGTWAGTCFALVAAPVWLLTVLLRRPQQAWMLNHVAARLLLALAGIRVSVQGRSRARAASRHLLVINHASYVDGLVLLAALPLPYRFVAKNEFRQQPLLRLYLQHLGVEFVERFAIRQSVQDSARMAELARRGERLAYFPEGTFSAARGLLPFHLGAFVAAIQAGVAVVPVALCGTRSILRGEQRLPRHGRVHVFIGEPLQPSAAQGDAFHQALNLRDRARAYIAARCGEADVATAAAAPRRPPA